jgi:sugar lactone lactonase YvrE
MFTDPQTSWPRDPGVAVVAGAPAAVLGEGPVWDARTQQLAYVDLLAGLVHVVTVDGGDAALVCTVELGRPVGAIAPWADGWILAVENGFQRRDADWQVTWSQEVFAADGVLRFNDASVDARGRFFAGTLAYDEPTALGAVYRLDPDGSHRVVIPHVGIANGIGWSPNLETMYVADSLAGIVHAYQYDEATGELGAQTVFYAHPDDGAAPDGLTVDAEGGVWIALWDGGRVLRVDSGGTVTDVVLLGVPRPTSLAFTGPELDRLYVTSAADRLTPEQIQRAPDSGRLHTFVPLIPGQPTGAGG